eukprot:TRINITY_DN17092_c0_g1_i13.p1 TRINITY_DN17092_c0_g1~~TRINITY_DN17092_c0_g1_i13.p1  ORF type:complete len:405 (+),score=114.40 TRINITY_DN17092_c0_g1_i13:223-1437(+)
MQSDWINSVTLVPKKEELRRFTFNYSRYKIPLIIGISIASVLLNILLTVLQVLLRPSQYPIEKVALYIGTDLLRMSFHASVLLLSKISIKLQSFVISLFPIVFTVMLTETYLYGGDESKIYIRIITTISVFVLSTQYTLVNYWYCLSTFIIAFSYPMVRAPKLVSTFAFELTVMTFFMAIICTYLSRRATVLDNCELYIGQKMNRQWKEIINTLEYGVIIMSDESPASILYYNPELKELIRRIHSCEVQENSIRSFISTFKIKVMKTGNERGIAKRELIKFVEQFKEEYSRNYHFFLDVPKLIIEIKVNKVIFDNREAKIISLIDCSSVQRLEQVQTECKYKTIMISSISHELRTPVNAILGTLELVGRFVPKESCKLLAMAKECCNMITSHINDLTVAFGNRM